MPAQQGLDAPDRNTKPKSFSKLLACFGDTNASGSTKSSVFSCFGSEPGQGHSRGNKNLGSQSTARVTKTHQQIQAKAMHPPAPPIPYYVHSVETVQTVVVPLGSIQTGPRLLPTTTIRYEMKMSSVAAWPSAHRECGLDDVSSNSGASSLSGELQEQRCLGDSKTCSSDLKCSSEQSSRHAQQPSANGDSGVTQPRQPKGSRVARIVNKLKKKFQSSAPAAPSHTWRLVAHGVIQHLPAQGPALTRSPLATAASVAVAPAVMEPSATPLAPTSSADTAEDLVSRRPGLSLLTNMETMVHPASPKTPQATSIPPLGNLSPTPTSPASLQTLEPPGPTEPEAELVCEATLPGADPSTPPTAIVSPWVMAPALALTAASPLSATTDASSRTLTSPFALCAASSPTSPTAARGLATTSLSCSAPLLDSATMPADAEVSESRAADAGMVERLNTPDISEDLPEQLVKPVLEIPPLDLALTAYSEKLPVGGSTLMLSAAAVLPSVAPSADIHTPSPPTTPRSAAKPSVVHIPPSFEHDAQSVALARLSITPGTALPPVGSTLSLRDLIVAEPHDACAMIKATDGWERDLPDSSAGSPMQWSMSSVTNSDPMVEVETPLGSVDCSSSFLPKPMDAAPDSLESVPPASAPADDLTAKPETITEPSPLVTEASPLMSPVICSESTSMAHWVKTSSGLWEPANCAPLPLGRAASDRCFTIAIDGGFFRRTNASPPAPSTPVPSSSMDLPRTRPSADAGAAAVDGRDDGAASPRPNSIAPSTPTYLPADSAWYAMASTPSEPDADDDESEVSISGAVTPTEAADSSPIRRVPSFGEALGLAAPAAVSPADSGAHSTVYSSAFQFPGSFAFVPSNSNSDDESEVDVIQLPMLSTAFLEPRSFAVPALSEHGSDNESELSLAPVPRHTVLSYALSIGSQTGSDSDDDDRS